MIQCRSAHAASCSFIDGKAFSGKSGLVYRARPFGYRSVDGNALSRPHDKYVADFYLRSGDRRFRSAAYDVRFFRRQIHERFDRIRRFSFAVGFKRFADSDERHDHRRRFEIQVVQIRMRARRIARRNGKGHQKQNGRTVCERCTASECDERVHVRSAVHEAFKTARKKLPVDKHDGDRKKHFIERNRHGIVVHGKRNRPLPHDVPHGHIHERHEQNERSDKTLYKVRRFRIFESCAFGRRRNRSARIASIKGRAVARLIDCGADRVRACRGRKIDVHRIRQKAHRNAFDAGNGCHRFFDMCAARGARHASYRKFCHIMYLVI